MSLRGKKVTIFGLGQHGGGVTAARYCAEAGAIVTITDIADEIALAESLSQLRGLRIEKLTLGRHVEDDFRAAEVIVINPAVRPNNYFVEIARAAGAKISSEIEMFLEACPAQVIGVTGTVGKSTTAAMLADILQTAGRRVWLGGNIGYSLLGDLQNIQSGDLVVLELSSFQLHWLSENACWPRGAVVTNCSPNHLDWHTSWQHYIAAKQRLIQNVPSAGGPDSVEEHRIAPFAVLNSNDPEVGRWQSAAGRRYVRPWTKLPPLKLPGEHNLANAACAAAAASACGVDEAAISAALAAFAGLPHRLQLVAEISDRQFIDDSKSTSPAAAMAAIEAMNRPTWLLLGGADSQADFTELAAKAVQCMNGVAAFGATAHKIASAIGAAQARATPTPGFRSIALGTLQEAVGWCIAQSAADHAILLSPGCPSTDQFRDFADRGEQFRRFAMQPH